MTTLTQKERIASLESYAAGHAREHELAERVWMAKLEAIEARLASMERALRETLENTLRIAKQRPADDPDGQPEGARRISRRDISVASGAAALTSVLWWLAELLQSAARGA